MLIDVAPECAVDIFTVNSGDEDGSGATSALVSFQDAQGVEVSADSWMTAFAPGGMEDSSLSVSRNVTVASSTINQVTNVSNVSATNLATALDLSEDTGGMPTLRGRCSPR